VELSFTMRVTVPADILRRELDNESVILNLNSGSCFVLDESGTRMWTVLTTSESIQAAYEVLLDEYDVEAKLLRQDLHELIEKLIEHDLVEVSDG
jgi:hypothetical protein